MFTEHSLKVRQLYASSGIEIKNVYIICVYRTPTVSMEKDAKLLAMMQAVLARNM